MRYLRVLGGVLVLLGGFGSVMTLALWRPLLTVVQSVGSEQLAEGLWIPFFAWLLLGFIPSVVVLLLGLRLLSMRSLAAPQPRLRLACVAGAVSILVGAAAVCLVVPVYREFFNDFEVRLPGLTIWSIKVSMWLGGRATPDQVVPGLVLVLPLLLATSAGCIWAAVSVGRSR